MWKPLSNYPPGYLSGGAWVVWFTACDGMSGCGGRLNKISSFLGKRADTIQCVIVSFHITLSPAPPMPLALLAVAIAVVIIPHRDYNLYVYIIVLLHEWNAKNLRHSSFIHFRLECKYKTRQNIQKRMIQLIPLKCKRDVWRYWLYFGVWSLHMSPKSSRHHCLFLCSILLGIWRHLIWVSPVKQ